MSREKRYVKGVPKIDKKAGYQPPRAVDPGREPPKKGDSEPAGPPPHPPKKK